ncbi:MAG TPA: ATP-binding protein [Acidimicrobiales bacterium]|nr:ATP-binding protein [Acidimicrobiales bacterium]
MSASRAQLQFASEFALFLAAASGLAVMALRGSLLNRRTAGELGLTGGFLCLASSAFLHGSQLIDDAGSPLILGLRGAGLALVVLGCAWGWAAGRASRAVLVLSVALIAIATAVDAGGSTTFSNLVMAAGGVAMGAAVLMASRRSIAARVAATSAITLLIVVLVLGVAISAVLINTVQDTTLDRIRRRAENEAATAANLRKERLADAKVVASALSGGSQATIADLIAAKASPTASDIVTAPLENLSKQFLADVSLAYVVPDGLVHGVANLDKIQVVELAGKQVVTEALQGGGAERGSVELLGDQAFSVGVEPVRSERLEGLGGVAVALSRLDDNYLAQVASDDQDLSLALVKNSRVVASHGDQPDLRSIAGMLRAALVDGRTSRGVVGNRFVAVAPVASGNGSPQLALVASSPTTLVNRTRDDLFRNLFVVALGGALLALLFATATGARIGSDLSRLRTAAEAIQEGNLGVRTGISGEDEVGVLSQAFDSMASSVQEKTAAESRLRGRLEAVVDSMGEALVALDGYGRITDFNRAAEDLLGVRQSQAMGRPVEEVVRLRDEDGNVVPVLPDQAASAARWNAIGIVDALDGRRVPVAVSVSALRGPGADAAGNVVVLADLTRERQVEQMKKEFLSRVGHELRHPLVPLMGYAEILQRKEVPAPQAREMHAEMLDQSRKMLRIVEMLEFFAAAGAGISLRMEDVDPRSMIDDVVRKWQRRLPEPDVIRPRVRRTTPVVHADRRRLTWCIDELVDNAVKFSSNGGRIVVSAEPAAEGGVEISVTDHGKGMTQAEQDEVFEEFVQGDPSDTRPHGGLGLGLAFVRRVTEAHGGTLSCTSVVGKGSKFSIFVPGLPMERSG